MYVKVLIVSLITLIGVRPEPCKTPDNEVGECIPLTKCKTLLQAVLDKQIADSYIEQLHCGGSVIIPNVCCTSSTHVPETCKMPDDRVGVCKPLLDCSEVLIALTNNQIPPEFVDQLHCGGTSTKPHICCAEIVSPSIKDLTQQHVPGRYPINNTARICGYQHADDYFHPTNETVITEYPWTARIGFRQDGEDYEEYYCAGSLINHNYVLTAAQCSQHGDFKLSSIRLGEFHSSNQTDCTFYSDIDISECSDVEDYYVESVIVHPGYNFSEPGGSHDIALIKLNRDVVYTDYIRPVCLAGSNIPKPQERDELTISGWGWLPQSYNTYRRSQFKQKAALIIQANKECEEKSKTVDEGQGCSFYSHSKVCLYENGGPLVFSHKYRWYQEGISVDGRKNCIVPTSAAPLVYTKVSDYIDWIIKTVGVL